MRYSEFSGDIYCKALLLVTLCFYLIINFLEKKQIILDNFFNTG